MERIEVDSPYDLARRKGKGLRLITNGPGRKIIEEILDASSEHAQLVFGPRLLVHGEETLWIYDMPLANVNPHIDPASVSYGFVAIDLDDVSGGPTLAIRQGETLHGLEAYGWEKFYGMTTMPTNKPQ